MLRRWLRFALFACIAMALGAGVWRVHALNLSRAVAEFQDAELRSADVIAAILGSQFLGAARTLRALAAGIERQPDAAGIADLLDPQMRCAGFSCFVSLAVYDARGTITQLVGRPLTVAPGDMEATVRWAADPANASKVRTVLSTSRVPALVLFTPTFAPHDRARPGERRAFAGVLAAEIEFESLLASYRAALDSNGQRASTFVLDARGNVMFDAKHPEMRLNNVFNRTPVCSSCHKSLRHVERMLEMKHGLLQYELHGVPHLAAVAPFEFEDDRWVAAVSVPAESAGGLLSAELRQLGLLMAALLLATGVTVHVTWKDRRRRIHAEAEGARRAQLERSHAELTVLNRRLQLAADEWRTTVDTMDAALMVLDPALRIERMNVIAADMLPGARFSWLNMPGDRLKDHPPWDSAVELARHTIGEDAISTARIRDSASGKTWDLWCRPRARGTTDRRGVVIVARDMTALVDLQNSVRRSETMAALGSLVAGVAHEVRRPLFAISSLVDAWSAARPQDPSRLIDALKQEVCRLQTLMTELLEYGAPSAPTMAPYRLAPVIEEAIRSCSHESAARGVTVAARHDADAMVWMDPQRLVRVFINLAQNAVQHSPRGTQVTMEVRSAAGNDGSWIEVLVRDRGPGFPPDDLARVFTPFFSRRPGGFGLGLAITERIVSEHRGKVVAANHPEGGALVTVSLPLSEPAAPAHRLQGAQPC